MEEFLEPFYEATNVLSATDFPTSNHRDLILFELKEHLESQINNELLGTMTKAMLAKFNEIYNDDCSLTASFAPYLDPRLRINDKNLDQSNQTLFGKFKNYYNEYYKKTPKASSPENLEISSGTSGILTSGNTFFFKKRSTIKFIYISS